MYRTSRWITPLRQCFERGFSRKQGLALESYSIFSRAFEEVHWMSPNSRGTAALGFDKDRGAHVYALPTQTPRKAQGYYRCTG